MRGRVFHIVGLLLLLAGATACFKDANFEFETSGKGSDANLTPYRTKSPDVRNVLLYIAAGFNTLSNYLAEDIADLEAGTLPGRNSSTDPVLLVLSRLPRDPMVKDFSLPSAPVLFRMYAGEGGEPVRDTLFRWGEETPVSYAATITEALQLTNDLFPGNRYGVIFSSHASGWLPPRYYDNPSVFESGSFAAPGSSVRRSSGSTSPEVFPPIDRQSFPPVKSVGMDNTEAGADNYEMDLDAFADAIPVHLDYLIFDACLMGGIEVAYELRDKVDMVGFSQAEMLAEGFDYAHLSKYLLTKNPDPVAYCRSTFNYYNTQSGIMQSATISVVDTRELDDLARVCNGLFQQYRTQIASLPGSKVQGYFQYNRHFYYDLKDILVQAGISEEEEARLQNALDKCLLYKAATPSVLGFSVNHYSGLSMYLPSMGSAYLDNYYRNHIAWNKATGLVN